MSHDFIPEKGQWFNPGHELPTAEGRVTGIISINPEPDNPSKNLVTVQCSTCHNTYTDIGIIALNAINFARPTGIGNEPFRRCTTCRTEDRHPSNAEYLRHVQRVREAARGRLSMSQDYSDLQERSLRAEGSERMRLHAELEDMLRKCDEVAHKKADEMWEAAQ